MREPFKKHVPSLPAEQAHGIGARTMILSDADQICSNLQAMTLGILPPKSILPKFFEHPDKDEIIHVICGKGYINFQHRDPMLIEAGDVVCIPAGTPHQLENPNLDELAAYFIRIYTSKND